MAELEPDLREHDEFVEVDELMTGILDRGTSADQQRAHVATGRDLRQLVRSLATTTGRGVCPPVVRTPAS